MTYHDKEWGVPVHDDRTMFEFLLLEGAQAGLNWYTVLQKRANYRQAFDHFNPRKIANYGENITKVLLEDFGIIRNRLKIHATINNAQRFLELQKKFGSFDTYIWSFVKGKPIVNSIKLLSDYPATSPQSDVLRKDLRQRGIKFVGYTICYAHMQATGLINDHSVNCFRRREILDGY